MSAAWVACAALGFTAVQEPASPAPRARIVVAVSVDQLVPESLDRLAPWLTGGLGRFMRDGRVFPRAALLHGDTETGPGHAAYGTGRLPRHNGVISNDWLARDARASVYCYADPDSREVTSGGVQADAASSPRQLRCDGMADYIEAAVPGALTVAIGSKDRSAIGMSGRRADLALWWDKKRGGFRSSTWYGTELPAWVREHNASWQARLPFATGWESELPADFARSGTAPDERVGKGRWVAALSADHGVLELPETLAAEGYPARRITGREIADTIKDARNAISARFGADFFLSGNYRGLRLDARALAERGVDARAVREAYASELRKFGAGWMEHALTWDELRAIARDGAKAPNGLAAMEANSFDEERTSDVVTLQKPYTLPGVVVGTSHGTPHEYDRRIPLAFLGAGVTAGRDYRAASSIDALPTLFTLAGLPVPPGLDGRALPLR